MGKCLDVSELIEKVSERYIIGPCPHGSNILHQLKNKKLSKIKRDAVLKIVPEYLKFVDSINTLTLHNTKPDFAKATNILESYLIILRSPVADCFDSVTDFLTSAAPEFFLRIFQRMISSLELNLEASGQKDIPIELAFDPNASPTFIPRLQRVDIAILKPMSLAVEGENLDKFYIPIFVAESKTYFDKNMISGVAYSSTTLKSTFPRCKCVAIGEWSDFDLDKQSFAATSIDEIFILRHQKRSDYRSSGDIEPLISLTIEMIFLQVAELLNSYKKKHPSISDRLVTGKLIDCEMK